MIETKKEDAHMLPEEYYEFEHFFEGLDEEFVLAVLGIVGMITMVVSLVVIVGYIFQSIGLYSIAKNRGIQNPWLAWLPIGNYWIAGSIADQYQYVVNDQVKNRRKILLVLSIACALVSSLVGSMANGGLYLGLGKNVAHFAALGDMGQVLELIYSALDLATFVFWQICLYDLYTSCNPKHNVLFLVLGIIFGVTIPYFIFFNRKKELGMPPRKPQFEEPAWTPQDPPEEPWDNQ